MEIRWHGHAFFSLTTANGRRIVIDPFFAAGTSRARDSFRPDLVVVTHAHADHSADALAFDAPVLSNHEIANHLAGKGGRTTGMGAGGFYEWEGIRFWCAPAVHSSGFESPDGRAAYGGNPCGFVIDDGETRFYHTGDTALFGDMRHVVRDLLQPHVAAVPIGDRYTMGPAHAAKAVEWLGVNLAVPMHYGTFPLLTGTPKEFERHVGTAARVVVPPLDGGLEVRGGTLVRELAP